MDTDRDGKVSLEEFARYYRKNGGGPARLALQPGIAQQSTVLTDTLFHLLDTDKDGKLSRSELEAVANVLRKFDSDDDDLLTSAEIQNVSALDPNSRRIMQLRDANAMQPGAQFQIPFVLVPREEPGERMKERLKVAQDLLTRFDRNKDGKLSREEIGFPKELFDWMKPGASGLVDKTGVLRWLLAMPDVELTVHLGKDERGDVEVVPTGRQQVPTLPVRKGSPISVSMKLGRVSLNVIRMEQQVFAGNSTQLAMRIFQQFDPDKKGFITAKQLEGRQFQPFLTVLQRADRNEDGRFTEKELLEYVDVMSGASGSVTGLLFSDGGQGLFELLDTNRDGRLSVRELRQAWSRLREYDQDGDGKLGKNELPRQVQLSVVKGAGTNVGVLPPAPMVRGRDGMPANPRGTAPAGPLWFRKMDVNGDGDVSPREFLGSPEDFARIDTDGDGLISLEEAIKADERMKEKAKP